MADIRINLDKKTAHKLQEALCKGRFEELTSAELSALNEFLASLVVENYIS